MQSAQSNTLLIVDDQAVTRSIVKHMLVKSGYDVAEAESGEQALALAGEKQFGAVILDLRMPGIDGIETCRRLRAMEQYRVTPVLMVTAMDELAAMAEAFEVGCDDFIPKPVDWIVLQARLKGHMQRAELYYQLERVRQNLNRYISPRTQQMVERYSGSGNLPPPEKLEACILFTDIRGFTQLSQTIEPERLFSLLSRQLAYQVDLVYRYRGYVDKYAGDGIMAVFEGEDMVLRGCQCALDIIAHASRADADQQEQLFAVGCGIHQGPAVIGNIGSPDHLDYSVIGESVNLAARLCGFANPMSIVASGAVHGALKDKPGLRFSSARHVEIKGFKQLTAVFGLEAAEK
jgi:class 3 adenylate cyclase